MWVLKFHGETLYVNHVDCLIPWSTKETPDNSHTKGSIKVKDCLLSIDEENTAKLSTLTQIDKIRLRNQKLGITRIMFSPNGVFHRALVESKEFKHSPFKLIRGACSSGFVICDLLDRKAVTIAMLKYTNEFRIVKPNESYYDMYDITQSDNIPVDYGHPSTPYEYS